MNSLFFRTIIFIFSFLFVSCNYISQNIIKEKDSLFFNDMNLQEYELFQEQSEENKIIINSEKKSNKLKDRICNFNYAHFGFSFLFLPLFSIILIIKDLREDKNFTRIYSVSQREKAKEEFKSVKNTYITSGKYLFSWFLMKYIYPLTSLFLIYSYEHPRYVRFLISTIKILLNILLTTILLFGYIFKESDNSINFQNIITSFSIIIIISIIMHFFFQFSINYLLEHDDIRRKIFKPKYENLRKYVYYVIKKDILFNSKWHLIRNRMLSYYRICGPFILQKNKKIKHDKYERYVKNKRNNYQNSSETLISFNSSLGSNEDEKSSFLDSGLKEKLLPSINNIKIKSNINKNENIINTKKITSKNNVNGNLCITQGAEPISFSKYGVNNMKLKTLKKIEDIRNRYITNKNSVKFDGTVDVETNYKTFDNLDIEALDNFTYISTDAMINKLNKINSNSNKMMLNFFTNGTLLVILTLLNIALVLMSLTAKESKHVSDIDDWLWVIFIEIIIVNFGLYLGISLFISVFLSRSYGYKKRNCFYKMIFNVFIEKYIRYLFRMRLLIIKYQKEFNFIEK